MEGRGGGAKLQPNSNIGIRSATSEFVFKCLKFTGAIGRGWVTGGARSAVGLCARGGGAIGRGWVGEGVGGGGECSRSCKSRGILLQGNSEQRIAAYERFRLTLQPESSGSQ